MSVSQLNRFLLCCNGILASKSHIVLCCISCTNHIKTTYEILKKCRNILWSTGLRPTNDISVEFEIRPKIEVLCLKIWSTDHNETFHKSRQCDCPGVWEISLWSFMLVINYSSLHRNTASRTGACWSLLSEKTPAKDDTLLSVHSFSGDHIPRFW